MAIVTPVVQPDYTTSPARFVETATGKQVLLRGVNVNMTATLSTYQHISDLGCNFVRVNVYWDQIEPNAPTGSGTNWGSYVHSYDATALGMVDAIVNFCAGLTVQGLPVMCLIDLHQAGWSPYFGGFSGVPSWYYTDNRFPGSAWTTSQQPAATGAWWTTEAAASQAFYSAFASAMVARYSQHANVVMYGSFNEPNPGNLAGTSLNKTDTMHTWLAPVVRAMSAADTPSGGSPTRGITVMARGGGKGFGSVTFSQFGTIAQQQALNLVAEAHMYYVGKKPGYPAVATGDYGINGAGDDFIPNDTAVHINLSPGYTGQQAYQQAFYGVYAAKANTLGLPLFIGEWGCNYDDSGWANYQSQMQAMFDANKWSTTRWLLAPVSGAGSLNIWNGSSFTGTGTALQTWFQSTTFVLGGTSSAPVNTTVPAISDTTPQVGEQLTTDHGAWNANPAVTSYRYQWQVATSSGGPYSNIGGATSTAYTVQAGDLGKFLRTQVTAANTVGNATATSAATSAVAASGGTVPVNTAAPVSSDTTDPTPPPQVGDIMQTTNGTWTNTPTSFTYQWQRLPAGGAIVNITNPSDTANTYILTADDVGAQVRCSVTAINGSGSSVPANTQYSGAVAASQQSQSAVIWAAGDMGAGGNHANALAVASNIPSGGAGMSLVVHSGDNYAIGKNTDLTADVPDVFGPSGRNVYPIFIPMIGNHDWDNHVAGYDSFYTGKGTKANISPHYGRIDIAGWTFIFLNTMEAKTASAGATSPAPDNTAGLGATQLSFLKNNLPGGSNNPNGVGKQCIVFGHHPRFSPSQSHPDNANLADMWNALQGKCVAYIHGHAHNLSVQPQRDGSGAVAHNAADGTPSGVYDICCGAGGEGNYDQNTGYAVKPLYFRGNSTNPQYGYLAVKIGGNQATFELHDKSSGINGTPLYTLSVIGSVGGGGGGGGNPPVEQSLPTVSDTTPVASQLLSFDPGQWTGDAPITFRGVWQSSPDNVTWATAAGIVDSQGRYSVANGDVGLFLRIQVTASNAAGRGTANSAATSAVAAAPSVPINTGAPQVTPTVPSVSTQLSTDNGSWDNTPTGFTYQWQEKSGSGTVTNIGGATSSTYLVQQSDVGFQISCQVVASNGSGNSAPVQSNWTQAVANNVPGVLTVNITDPPPGATVTSSIVTVTVDAEDTDGVQSVQVRAFKTDGSWTGAWVGAVGAAPTFQAQVALSGGDGTYEIDAQATANPPH